MNVSCICDPEVRPPIKLSIDNFYLDAAGNKDIKFSMSKSIELTFEEWNTALWKEKEICVSLSTFMQAKYSQTFKHIFDMSA